MAFQYNTASCDPGQAAAQRSVRMRALYAPHRARLSQCRIGRRRRVQEDSGLGWYLLRLTVHALGSGLLLSGLMAVVYFPG